MEIQLGFFEAILDILYLKPVFILGLILVGALLYWLFRKDQNLPKFKIAISSMLMYYYLCIILKRIVGIPTINEFIRLTSLGESFFNPNISLIPFIDGMSLGFLLNVFCFIPLGFLSPIISRTYEQAKKVALLGFGLSLMIEVSQLFTLYRATDIDDLIANLLGTIIGYLCFKITVKLKVMRKSSKHNLFSNKDTARFLPILILLIAFVITFIS